MKKLLLLIGMCFFTLTLVAQETEKRHFLADQTVVPPQFKGEQVEQQQTSPICCYIEKNLELPDRHLIEKYQIEGTVVIDFTVEADGSLTNFVISNYVDNDLNYAVIDCIKETQGMWAPGMVNDKPAPMEKRIYVKFDIEGNPSFEEIARNYYNIATKRFAKGEQIQNSDGFNSKKRVRKYTRKYNSSIRLLNHATVYCPNDASIFLWKAKNYEQLGMNQQMLEMLERRKEVLSMTHTEKKLEGYYDLAVIKR